MLEDFYCVGCEFSKPRKFMSLIFGRLGICRSCAEEIYTTKDMTFEGREFTEMVVSPFLYKGVIGDAVRSFKFSGQRRYGDFLTAAALAYLGSRDYFDGCDLIVPVPLHKNRLMERGYNQSEIIADRMGKMLGLEVNTASLSRIRDTLHQSSLQGIARIENVRGAFTAPQGAFSGRNVILVDDIYTMGETANECARAIKGAGAEKVVVFTICRAMGKVRE